ncbi:uncharacterized protein MONBRDRAFT_32557 [Monosiga brevicollis MX1]|uniref:Disks large-associated protein 5 n=1 Tax=Monosiga brevicollis TaxID=81824 RepID=A9V0B0_MONBE|nr:uncharacterized protein MONBRDRAFT_32557 [Monosiga brevicollis MX1]EDQ89126.1 predicted protein [Monosiga brevicollis MX1]|eukprot:XP_001746231.1 hypothetical protein [Monosiga brevicollis MX1]
MGRLNDERKFRFKSHNRVRAKQQFMLAQRKERDQARFSQWTQHRNVPPSPVVCSPVSNKENMSLDHITDPRKRKLLLWQAERRRQQQHSDAKNSNKKPFVVSSRPLQSFNFSAAPSLASMTKPFAFGAASNSRRTSGNDQRMGVGAFNTAPGPFVFQATQPTAPLFQHQPVIDVQQPSKDVPETPTSDALQTKVQIASPVALADPLMATSTPALARGAAKSLAYEASNSPNALLEKLEDCCLVGPRDTASPTRPTTSGSQRLSNTTITSDLSDQEVTAATSDETPETAKGLSYQSIEFFESQLQCQLRYLAELCNKWEAMTPEADAVNSESGDEIRATIGQARLLSRKKLSKFESLCQDCRQGGRTKLSDLDGYWDACVQPQVEQLQKRFENLDMLKNNAWQPAEDEPAAPKKKRVKKTKSTRKASAAQAPARVSQARAFIQRMRARRQQDDASDAASDMAQPMAAASATNAPGPSGNFGSTTAEVNGSTVVLTPMRASRKEQEVLGSEVVLTPVRRSTRQTPSKYRRPAPTADADPANVAYKPNPAVAKLIEVATPPPAMRSRRASAFANSDSLLSPLLAPETPLAQTVRMSMTASAQPACQSPALGDGNVNDLDALLMESPLPAASRNGQADLIAFTPTRSVGRAAHRRSALQRTPFSARKRIAPQDRDMDEENQETGSVIRFARTTPSRRVRDELGTEVVFTPVRRSARIASTNATPLGGSSLRTVLSSLSEVPPTLDFGYMPNESLSVRK